MWFSCRTVYIFSQHCPQGTRSVCMHRSSTSPPPVQTHTRQIKKNIVFPKLGCINKAAFLPDLLQSECDWECRHQEELQEEMYMRFYWHSLSSLYIRTDQGRRHKCNSSRTAPSRGQFSHFSLGALICVVTAVALGAAILGVTAQLPPQRARLGLHGGAADICCSDEHLIIYFYALL